MTKIYQKLVDACFECPNCIKIPFAVSTYCFLTDDIISNPFDVMEGCPLKTGITGDGDE